MLCQTFQLYGIGASRGNVSLHELDVNFMGFEKGMNIFLNLMQSMCKHPCLAPQKCHHKNLYNVDTAKFSPAKLSSSINGSCILTGGDCVRSFKVLPDKRHILTADCDDKITLWDVFTVERPIDMTLSIILMHLVRPAKLKS